jgi:hypothetical protein
MIENKLKNRGNDQFGRYPFPCFYPHFMPWVIKYFRLQITVNYPKFQPLPPILSSLPSLLAYEIREIEEAIRIGSRGLEKTVEFLRAGDKIKDIARTCKKSMLDEGSMSGSFSTSIRIIDGVREKEISRIRDGSLVLFDFGARLESQYL